MQPSQSAPSGQSAKRALLATLAVFAIGCLSAPSALAADFTVDPTLPIAGELATFTPDVPPEDTTWDYEADGTIVPDETHTFAAAGSYDVTMNVSGGSPVTKTVIVNARPVASFNYSPAVADPNEWVVFQSTSTDADDSIASVSWDFGDGTAVSTASNPAHQFADPGQYDVTLLVTDEDGTTDSVVHQVVVRDLSVPTAAFHREPGSAVVLQTGQVATFRSDSAAIPGSILSWQIDGVSFGSDQSVTTSFATAGFHVVRLTVSQPNGTSDEAVSIFQVNAAPAAPAPPAPSTPAAPAAPALMKPFPTVRLVGLVVPTGARITLVEARGAPRGARVTVRCTGTGCPFRSRRRVAETGRVRLSRFPKVLAAGARIEVLVRSPGVIGKYVRFRVRAGKRPLRIDRCLMPGASEPTRCT